jgi:hypothetical protein
VSRIVGWCLKDKSFVFLATLLLLGSGAFATTRLNQESSSLTSGQWSSTSIRTPRRPKPRCRTPSPASSRQLPQQAGEPEVQRQSAAEFPILNISLAAGDEDLAALTTYTRDEAIPRLVEVEGAARVKLVGGADEAVRGEPGP